MLQKLYIKNIILVKELVIEFDKGLNIITGETGAGKSTIIDSINILFGKKSGQQAIGNYGDNACIEVFFNISENKNAKNFLDSLGIEYENNEIVIRRTLSKDGRSRSFINGVMVNTSSLKDISMELIDLHGQHDHQSLLDSKKHICFLDNFLHGEDLFSEYYQAFLKYKSLEEQKEFFEKNISDAQQNMDFLEFQIKEIEDARLDVAENERLYVERNILKNFSKYHESFSEILNLLNQKEGSVLENLQKVQLKFSKICNLDNKFSEIQNNLDRITIELADITQQISQYFTGLDFEPGKMDNIELRLFKIEELKRKYKKDISGIIDYYKQIKEQVNGYENKDFNLEQINKDITLALEKVLRLANSISEKRKKGGAVLKKEIEKELKELGLNNAQFFVRCDEVELNTKGKDKVVFCISTNKGIKPDDLSKIASGGEISRIMLALKTVFADADTIGSLVFDEIDVNLGGKEAIIVGNKLKKLASYKQLICITHMPQIASRADNHYVVSKSFQNGNTETNIKLLSQKEKASEIARMLGGEDITSVALRHAEEMLQPV